MSPTQSTPFSPSLYIGRVSRLPLTFLPPSSSNSPTPRVPRCGIFPHRIPTSCPFNRETAGSAPRCDGAMDSSGQDIVGGPCDLDRPEPAMPAAWPLGWARVASRGGDISPGCYDSSPVKSACSVVVVVKFPRPPSLGCTLDAPVIVVSETSLLQVYSKLAISLSRPAPRSS